MLLITDRAEVSSPLIKTEGLKKVDVASGTTIISGTKLTADTVVLQWKKAKADLTEYDTP